MVNAPDNNHDRENIDNNNACLDLRDHFPAHVLPKLTCDVCSGSILYGDSVCFSDVQRDADICAPCYTHRANVRVLEIERQTNLSRMTTKERMAPRASEMFAQFRLAQATGVARMLSMAHAASADRDNVTVIEGRDAGGNMFVAELFGPQDPERVERWRNQYS